MNRTLFTAVLFSCGQEKNGAAIDTSSTNEPTSVGSNSGDSGTPPDPMDDIDPTALPAAQNPCRDPVKGEVEDVTDGDTIKVRTGRGIERVRLIGIDTPEVDHSGPDDECLAEEAKAFLANEIDGVSVWLTFDRECEDAYDRTLAYVHRGTSENDFIQRKLLKGGWAAILSIEPNVAFRSIFSDDQEEAYANGLGIWGECR